MSFDMITTNSTFIPKTHHAIHTRWKNPSICKMCYTCNPFSVSEFLRKKFSLVSICCSVYIKKYKSCISKNVEIWLINSSREKQRNYILVNIIKLCCYCGYCKFFKFIFIHTSYILWAHDQLNRSQVNRLRSTCKIFLYHVLVLRIDHLLDLLSIDLRAELKVLSYSSS